MGDRSIGIHEALRWVIVASAGTLFTLGRPFDSAQRFALWAEDGVIFTAGPRQLGVWRSFRTTYAGYLHLIPRAVAAIASALPLRWTPVLFAVAACSVSGVVGATAWRGLRAIGLSSPVAALLGGCVVVLPAAGWEVVDTLTNVQWYCLAGVVVFAATYAGGYRPAPAPATVLLLIAVLTSPLAAVVVPVILVIAWSKRQRDGIFLAGGALLGAGIQVAARLGAPQGASTGGRRPVAAAGVYALRVVDGSVTGDHLEATVLHVLGRGGCYALAVALLAVVGTLTTVVHPDRRPVLLALLFSAAVLCVGSWWLRPAAVDLRNFGYTGSDFLAGRYMGAPALSILLVLVLGVAWNGHRAPGATLRAVGVGAVVVMLAFNAPITVHRVAEPLETRQIDFAERRCRATDGVSRVAVAVAPSAGWTLRLSCRQAFG